MFGKVFASLYQGSLRGQAHEILVFTNMIACADREGFVDKHPRAIAEECGITVDEVRAAIANLEAPDPESRSPDEEGRRLLRIDDHRAWGWRIVNCLKYKGIRDEDTRRETFRVSKRKRRARLAGEDATSTASQQASTASTQLEAEEEKETEKGNGVSGLPDPVAEIVNHLNAKAGTSFRPETETTRKLVKARLAGGATIAECIAVIDDRVTAWKADAKMREYLRPATLFNAEKFESYRGRLVTRPTVPETRPDDSTVTYPKGHRFHGVPAAEVMERIRSEQAARS